MSSHNFSRLPIQETAKWQFYSTTQSPVFCDSAINFSAFGPYPYPKDTPLISFFLVYAYLSSELRGSAPGDKTKISGIVGPESLKTILNSNGGGVIK